MQKKIKKKKKGENMGKEKLIFSRNLFSAFINHLTIRVSILANALGKDMIFFALQLLVRMYLPNPFVTSRMRLKANFLSGVIIGLNLQFYFSQTGCQTRVQETGLLAGASGIRAGRDIKVNDRFEAEWP